MGRQTGNDSGRLTASTRRRFLTTAGGAVTVGLAGCIGYGSDDDDDATAGEVVIGSNHPLTGPIADTGGRMDQAIELAAMRKNEAGGIESMDGADVRVISADNEGQQELGSEAADELVEAGADVLTGCFSSPVTDDATRVAEREQIPFVISAAVDASILQETPLEYVYRPQPSSQRMADDHVEMMVEVTDEHGIDVETAGIFYLDNTYGQSIRNGLQNALPDHGIDIVEEAAIMFGQTPETQVTEFRASDPDALLATTFRNQTEDLVREMEQQEYEPPLFGGVANEALVNPDAIAEMGEFADGALSTGYNLDPFSEHTQDVLDRYQEEFGDPFDNNVGMAYAAAEVIIAAVEEAGTTDSEELNETLQTIEVTDHILAMPPISFRDDGENENAAAALQQIQDGEAQIVRPAEFAVADPQF